MVPLFKPQIIALIDARDRTIERWVAEVNGGDTPHETVFEDREREVASYLDIDVNRQVKAIEAEIRRRDR
jgi:hypothetical protein